MAVIGTLTLLVTCGLSQDHGCVGISATGAWFTYGSGAQMFLVQRESGRVMRLTLPDGHSAVDCAFAPNGSYLAVSSRPRPSLRSSVSVFRCDDAKLISVYDYLLPFAAKAIGFSSSSDSGFAGSQLFEVGSSKQAPLSSLSILTFAQQYGDMRVALEFVRGGGQQIVVLRGRRREVIAHCERLGDGSGLRAVSPLDADRFIAWTEQQAYELRRGSQCVLLMDKPDGRFWPIGDSKRAVLASGNTLVLRDATRGDVKVELGFTHSQSPLVGADGSKQFVITLRKSGVVELWSAGSGKLVDKRFVQAGLRRRLPSAAQGKDNNGGPE